MSSTSCSSRMRSAAGPAILPGGSGLLRHDRERVSSGWVAQGLERLFVAAIGWPASNIATSSPAGRSEGRCSAITGFPFQHGSEGGEYANPVRNLSSAAKTLGEPGGGGSSGIRAFHTAKGAQMKTSHPLVIALISRLMESSPRLIHFAELRVELGRRMRSLSAKFSSPSIRQGWWTLPRGARPSRRLRANFRKRVSWRDCKPVVAQR